jgi:ABC-2 type transport system ATP-binding protein
VGLSKRFGSVVAVDECALDVHPGDIFGLLGPNGAGKTTTIRMLAGLVRPDRGTITLFGQPLAPATPPPRDVGILIERPALYPYLSALGNLRVFGVAAGLPDPRRSARDLLAMVGLAAAADRRVRGFSTGMRQRLAIALALLSEPRLLILDEPTTGLDPEGLVEIREMLRRLRDEGVTIVLSSHLLAEVDQVCNRVAIMNRGRIVASDLLSGLRAGEGEHVVRFAQQPELLGAQQALERQGISVNLIEDPAGLVISRSSISGEATARLLAAAGLYPSEISVRRPSLESYYLELVGTRVGDHPEQRVPERP